ncbi:sigma-70 family RNA polymerase sigma factor [Nonomuraea sp. MCN248]|uniref:Sigma-70 family RNA polymerase sigma factor n=1 Tax=Nonomuraea corallina TaxID=2989783 RepID=A0ABT4S5G5_9ACTN|nr:sigma-70 family RNA polymerase sigma factor [Nonomuraea corallina]MDA0632439.1 sigma-70 family RNA polymerase sigma factor [Nonomuraea corallina]
MPDPRQLAELLLAADSGDQSAWDELEARFGPRMWAVARACGLNEPDAADAVQGAWLRLLEHLHDIREPAGVGAWLATTTRREALLLIRKSRSAPAPFEVAHDPDPESAVLEADGNRLLWKTVSALKEPCRSLLTLVASDLGSRQVAVRLGLPIGSVGPTRARCLEKLRTLISLQETVQ